MWTGEIEWIRRQNLKKVDHYCVCWMVFFLFWYIKPKLASMWCWGSTRGSAFVFLVCMIWWFLSVIVMLILEVI